MPLIQTHGRLILRNHAKICTATQNLRQKDNLIDRNGEKKFTHTLTVNQLVDLIKIHKKFSLKFLKIHPYYSFGLRRISTPAECIIGQ